MIVEKRSFGYTNKGENVDCYTLCNGGISVEILTYGGIIRSLFVPVNNELRDVALGYDDMAGYENQSCYMGALIGRVGNRIGNAVFSLNDRKYKVDVNDGPNCLHGGLNGFDKKIWTANTESDALVLSLNSPDMECGFPGNMTVKVRYSVDKDTLTIEYTAKSDTDTPISLTNHCYFNLEGHNSGSIENHTIQILADYITPVDERLIPTGELLDVTGTPFDLREAKSVGAGMMNEHSQIVLGNGYDHNYVLTQETELDFKPVAVLESGGLKMTCHTTQPGIQFYSGNFIADGIGKNNAKYLKRSGLCLETQGWPDAVNHPAFPSCILRAGEVYNHKTAYSFSI